MAGMDTSEPRPSGVVGALLVLADLRTVLATIPLKSPMYRSGSEPTAADACAQLLESIEYQIKQIEKFVGGV